ncbi:MAG: hypothetical protein ACOYYS_22300 [Chloroflexota bacterium]
MNRILSFFFAIALLLLAAACTSAQTAVPTSAVPNLGSYYTVISRRISG